MSRPDLVKIFHSINAQHFENLLTLPQMVWNTRLRASAGRFTPGNGSRRTTIEVATYLLVEPDRDALLIDTVAHEMIHLWLWERRQPHGHSPEFNRKRLAMGVSRYNPVPRRYPPKYVYACPECEGEFPSRRRLSKMACARCCKRLNAGKFDRRFEIQLKLVRN